MLLYRAISHVRKSGKAFEYFEARNWQAVYSLCQNHCACTEWYATATLKASEYT
jgi:hypothetical protein